MPKLKNPSFEIVVGTSTRSPELAAQDAEKKAKKAGGEQVGIAASVLGGGGTSAAVQDQMLDNIAKNIYQLVQCTCPTLVGQEIKKPGVPPPTPLLPIGKATAGGQLWVVYILLRH